jgi:hypothetical protein
LGAQAASPASRVDPDSSAAPTPSTVDVEGDPRDSDSAAVSTQPARTTRPRRRLLNLFPESALEPERPASSGGPQLVFQPRIVSTAPDMPVAADVEDRPASSEVGDSRMMASDDSQTESRRVPPDRVKDDLLAAIRTGRGAVVVIAPTRTDESSLSRTVIQELDRRVVSSLVVAPKSFEELLKMMLVDFGAMTTEAAAHAEVPRPRLLEALRCFLESLASLHARAVILIEEAERVPAVVLAELHAISAALDAGMLQVVLVGGPELTNRLKRRVLHEFNASVAHRLQIEVPEQVDVRVETPPALTIAETPAIVDTTHVETADIDSEPESPRASRLGRLLIVAAVTSIVLAGAGALLWVLATP